ncbi:MAG: baseplate J/gp47 family protein [Acidobacteriaceae bacterium]
MSLPIVMSSAGPQPTPPSVLQQALLQAVAAQVPGYTATLPGSLIEDISSTDVGALVAIDQARVDAVNSVTPYGANPFVLAQLGAQFGIAQGTPANASVYVVFSGPAGYVLQPGFTVSDGSNQYALQNGGIIGASGTSPQLYAVATNAGTFPIPANTVNQIVTSVPSTYTITVNNPEAGTPATSSESVQSYRSRVMLAGTVSATGTPALLKSLLYSITGVQQQYVSVNHLSGGWQVICGGGDSYSIANAILQAVPDISVLQGSQLAITAMTAANPVVITTNLNHNFVAGNTFTVVGADPAAYDLTYTVASVTSTTITTTTDGSTFGIYVSGASFSPNPRNVTASVFQNPNTYDITFVNPPQQIVTVAVTWNTTQPNFTAGLSVNQLAAPSIQSYINYIYVGQPINLLEMTAIFQNAVSAILSAPNITTLTFAVTINGVIVTPSAGTSIIEGDPESYFYASATGVTVAQG